MARCLACYRRVQGRHPEQTSDALRAAAVQYGPRLLGFAADLKHRIGASYRKCSSVLLTLTGLVVASAALVRSSHRLRRLARPSYDRLVEAARHSVVQHVDETGWKIGGRSAWLWVFADEHTTLYRIRRSRGHDVVVEVLGETIRGAHSAIAVGPPALARTAVTAMTITRGNGCWDRSWTAESPSSILPKPSLKLHGGSSIQSNHLRRKPSSSPGQPRVRDGPY